jgi:hypothetical protein
MIEYFNSSRDKSSKERLKKAFNFEIDDFNEVPLILQTNSYWLTGHGPDEIPEDYFATSKVCSKFKYYFRHSFKK